MSNLLDSHSGSIPLNHKAPANFIKPVDSKGKGNNEKQQPHQEPEGQPHAKSATGKPAQPKA